MNPISKALADTLNKKQLSPQVKHTMLNGLSPMQNRSYKPHFIIICMCLIAAFLLVTMNSEKNSIPHMAGSETELGSVDTGIVQYFNDMVEIVNVQGNEQVYNVGDAYLMRLALEQNSGQFYSDSSLNKPDRFLISELLHYMQEVVWQGKLGEQMQQVHSIEELTMMAPTLISEWEQVAQIPYVKVQDELGNSRSIDRFEEGDWISYAFVALLFIALISYLLKNQHRTITLFAVIVGLVFIVQPFLMPNKNNIGYDEQSLVKVIHENLVDQHVLVGKPTLEYAATYHETRAALVSYDNGLNVLGVFDYEDGSYQYSSIMWHSEKLFHESSYSGNGEEQQLVRVNGFMPNHEVAMMKIMENRSQVIETRLNPVQPKILFYKTPADTNALDYEFLGADGEAIR